MIKSATQLKALIRNKAEGNSGRSQLLIRNYAMERFMERVSLSVYKNHFILKGGMLVSAMVGLDSRATLDIDTTIRDYPLNKRAVQVMILEITSIQLEDNTIFELKNISDIMDEAEYSGIRITLNAFLGKTRIPLKIDISTGDIITPGAVEYRLPLMFENRYILVWAYNLETVLAEKIETIIARATLNTRMRDYYDLYILPLTIPEFNVAVLKEALRATSRKRQSEKRIANAKKILEEIAKSDAMKRQWNNYIARNEYAGGLAWEEVLDSVKGLCRQIL